MARRMDSRSTSSGARLRRAERVAALARLAHDGAACAAAPLPGGEGRGGGAKRQRDEELGTIARPRVAEKTTEKPKLLRPHLYEVLLHNDDYTTQEFVVYVLERYFQLDSTTATKIMLHVHTRGVGVAGVFPYDTAETKAEQVMGLARKNGMPLLCSIRPQAPEGEGGGGADQ